MASDKPTLDELLAEADKWATRPTTSLFAGIVEDLILPLADAARERIAELVAERDEALCLAEGPSTLLDLARGSIERGFQLESAETREKEWAVKSDAHRRRAEAAERALAEARATLHRIAYSPIGHAEAAHREVLDRCVDIARAALAPAATPGAYERRWFDRRNAVRVQRREGRHRRRHQEDTMSLDKTALEKALEDFKAKMEWSDEATDWEKTLVIGNLNGFVGYLAALPAEEGWRPIETAPRDGTPLLGFMPSYYQRQGGQSITVWMDGAWFDSGAFETEPTHWMPLPASPAPPQEK